MNDHFWMTHFWALYILFYQLFCLMHICIYNSIFLLFPSLLSDHTFYKPYNLNHYRFCYMSTTFFTLYCIIIIILIIIIVHFAIPIWIFAERFLHTHTIGFIFNTQTKIISKSHKNRKNTKTFKKKKMKIRKW
jgi:hypothetical protein